MTQLERLMYIQGNCCFFCQKTIAKGEASVEHLLASSKGGGNNDDNCVACCKTLNSVLGSLPLKEKLRILLNQKGPFKCPASSAKKQSPVDSGELTVLPVDELPFMEQEFPTPTPTPTPTPAADPNLSSVISFLKKFSNNRPRKLTTLRNSLSSTFRKLLTKEEQTEVVEQLLAKRYIVIEMEKLTYCLPKK